MSRSAFRWVIQWNDGWRRGKGCMRIAKKLRKKEIIDGVKH